MHQLFLLCRKLERVTGRCLIVIARYRFPSRKTSSPKYVVLDMDDATFRVSCNTLVECKRVLLDQFL